MRRYNDMFDGICSVLDYHILIATTSSNSNINRMRTNLRPNVNFKLYGGFCNTVAAAGYTC